MNRERCVRLSWSLLRQKLSGLRSSLCGGPQRWWPLTEIVRQQWTFSPLGSTSEVEDYQVELKNLCFLELTLKPISLQITPLQL